MSIVQKILTRLGAGGPARARFPVPFPALPALLLALVLALSGCAAPTIEQPALPAPKQFRWPLPELLPDIGRFAEAGPAEAQPRGQWWRVFRDPMLDDLVERSARNNNDVAQAAARLAQAQALVTSANADRAPQIGIGAAAERAAGANLPGGSAPRSLFQAGANLSYELDLFGRIALTGDAARLDALASEALLQSTRLLVQGQVAQTYLTLRALDEERALVREAVDAYRHTLDLTQRRHRAGDVGELDVARVGAELASNESDALAIDRQRATVETALAVLVGEAASDFALAPATWSTMLPRIPAGVPATLLTRRADVAAAQARLMAEQTRVGIARTAWFPSISLTAAGGFASPELGDLFQWSARAWGIGALLSLPLFDGGRREATLQNASARFDEALAAYRQQALVAFKDVEDQLSALQLLAQQAEAQQRAVDAARRATALSDSRYRNGMVSQLELLDARRSEVRNRRQALQVQAARYQATVGLIRALGGGWDEIAKVADAR
jgi:multidrug efflux system outer membrane protein